MQKNRTLILASASPRRKWLLEQLGLKPIIKKPEVEERIIRGENARALVQRLAREKGEAVYRKKLGSKKQHIWILSADTIVLAPGGKKIFGKPKHVKEAISMLSTLQGKVHEVLTGFYVAETDEAGMRVRTATRVVSSKVKMREMTPAHIRWYVKTGEPFDKAGAYAVQGIGASLIEWVKGSYTNVVGLPLTELMKVLEEKFGFAYE